MYFYVDESGHTGPNLFDPTQPMLYYGVLSSQVNVDIVAESRMGKLRKQLGVKRLHAAEIGNARLAQISKDLISIQKALEIRFDLYRVAKPDHAIICFFDQVFDAGLNPAVTWTGYWTPLRYVLLLKLGYLFDENLARKAWEARIEANNVNADQQLQEICAELLLRIPRLPDARSRQLFTDALQWAHDHPRDIDYNVPSKYVRMQIMPNVIGFQSVMHGIADRVKAQRKLASKIVVDRQSQFNKAQRSLAEFYANERGIPWESGPGLPVMDLTHIPTVPITFASSEESPGLELVDIHLWIFKRHMEQKELARELYPLIKSQLYRGKTDELSLRALENRWGQWFNALPVPTSEEIERGKAIMARDEVRRQKAMAK